MQERLAHQHRVYKEEDADASVEDDKDESRVLGRRSNHDKAKDPGGAQQKVENHKTSNHGHDLLQLTLVFVLAILSSDGHGKGSGHDIHIPQDHHRHWSGKSPDQVLT